MISAGDMGKAALTGEPASVAGTWSPSAKSWVSKDTGLTGRTRSKSKPSATEAWSIAALGRIDHHHRARRTMDERPISRAAQLAPRSGR